MSRIYQCLLQVVLGIPQRRGRTEKLQKNVKFADEWRGPTLPFSTLTCEKCGCDRYPAMLPDEHYSEIWGQIRIGYACECEASYQIQSSGGDQVNVGRDWTGERRRNGLGENVTRVVLPQDCSLIVYARTKFDFYHDRGIDPNGWGKKIWFHIQRICL